MKKLKKTKQNKKKTRKRSIVWVTTGVFHWNLRSSACYSEVGGSSCIYTHIAVAWHGTTDWFRIGKRVTSKLYIVTLLIQLLCREHDAKCWAEWSTSWNQDCRHACMLSHFSCIQLCETLWTAAHQAPLSTGFSRQECCSGLPFLSPKIARRNINNHRYAGDMTLWQQVKRN